MKVCKKCKVEQPETEFYKNKQNKCGLNSTCKSCFNIGNKWAKSRNIYREKSPYYSAANISKMCRAIIRRCQISGMACELTVALLAPLMTDFCANHKYSWEPKSPWKPSVDRIDNSKGYTLDNIQIVWMIENLCKNTFTNDDVIEFCKLKLESIKQ